MAGIGKGGAMSPVRKKQMMLLAGLCGTIAIIALVVGTMGGPAKPAAAQQAKEQITKKAFGAPGEKINEADVWRTNESAKVLNLQKDLEDLKLQLKQQQNDEVRKTEEAKKRAEIEAKEKAAAPPPPPPPPQAQGQAPGQGAGRNAAQLGTPPSGPGGQLGEQREVQRGIVKLDISREVNSSAAAKVAGAAASARPGMPPAGGQGGGDQLGGQSAETYLPAGSFLRAITLAGLDAPTGGQVQQNPHPIVFRITDYAQLPNRFRADYKECFVTGNGYGDISSERAYIRLDRMSCVTEQGGAIDVAVKGYVAGEDGKAGLRGTLVSKQGQVLANALLAGVASGIGHGITQSATTTSVSPLGSTQSVKDGQEFKAGIGQGVGKALDKLTNYYIQLAEKMFPIIEISAGREVDIVITKGISLERKQ